MQAGSSDEAETIIVIEYLTNPTRSLGNPLNMQPASIKR